MNLGEKIYQLRNERNMSQGDLADKLDVSRQSVSKWENNTAVPDLDKLIKLCDVFEISLDEITGREIPEEKPISIIRETKKDLTKTQLIGCILIGIGIISFLMPFGVFFAPSILICGIICLTVRKNPWYWCIWVVFLPIFFIMSWAMALEIVSLIIETAFLVVMAVITYKAFKDTEIVIPERKSIVILASSIVYDLLYALFRLNKFEVVDFWKQEIIIDDGVSSEMVTSSFADVFLDIFLIVGAGLSMIGIICSVKNLRKSDK